MGAQDDGQSLADQAHACAVQMWDAVNTSRPRPERSDFAHLDGVAHIERPAPPAPGSDPATTPVDPAAVQAALAQMRAGSDGVGGGVGGGTA